jgi:hypothetical protein
VLELFGRMVIPTTRWALFLGFYIITFPSWMPRSGLLEQSDILHGKSAISYRKRNTRGR